MLAGVGVDVITVRAWMLWQWACVFLSTKGHLCQSVNVSKPLRLSTKFAHPRSQNLRAKSRLEGRTLAGYLLVRLRFKQPCAFSVGAYAGHVVL